MEEDAEKDDSEKKKDGGMGGFYSHQKSGVAAAGTVKQSES